MSSDSKLNVGDEWVYCGKNTVKIVETGDPVIVEDVVTGKRYTVEPWCFNGRIYSRAS